MDVLPYPRCPQLVIWSQHVGRAVLSMYGGVRGVGVLLKLWEQVQSHIDKERYDHAKMHFHIQDKEAKWWEHACLHSFQTFSKMDSPSSAQIFIPNFWSKSKVLLALDCWEPGKQNSRSSRFSVAPIKRGRGLVL